MTDRAPPNDAYAPFRHRDYRLFIVMVLISSLSQQALSVAVGWDIYERTGSAMALCAQSSSSRIAFATKPCATKPASNQYPTMSP